MLLHKLILWECEELEIRKEKVPTKIKYPAFRDMPEKTRDFQLWIALLAAYYFMLISQS